MFCKLPNWKQAAQKKSSSEIENLRRSNSNRQSACGGLKPLNYLTKFQLCKTKLLDPFVFPISLFTCNRILDEFISKYHVKKTTTKAQNLNKKLNFTYAKTVVSCSPRTSVARRRHYSYHYLRRELSLLDLDCK